MRVGLPRGPLWEDRFRKGPRRAPSAFPGPGPGLRRDRHVQATRSRPVVYAWCIGRTNIDIDEVACAAVMERYGVVTKREAVNLALRLCAVEPLSIEEALSLEGAGWEGDLDQMRAARHQ